MAEKFVFLSLDHVTERLEELLLHGQDDIPTFLGGPNTKHDQYYPEEGQCPSRGGILKFDYYGMVQRLRKQREMFEKKKHVSFSMAGNSEGTTMFNGSRIGYSSDDDDEEENVSSDGDILSGKVTEDKDGKVRIEPMHELV